MSRLESEHRPVFEIAKDEQQKPTLTARPLHQRRQTVEEFDREFRLMEIEAQEQAFKLQKDRDPELAECLSNAQLLAQQGEHALAQNLFRAVLKLDSHNEVAIRGVAECARAAGQHEEAVQVLRQLVENHQTPRNFKLLGDQLYALEYNEDARGAYLAALHAGLADGDELFDVFKNMGNISLRIGDVAAAEEFYNKAYTIHPDSDILLVNFGSLALYQGDYEKALARFRESVTINDNNDKGWVGLAMIHREYGDSELAWANLEKALDKNPLNASAVKLVADWAMKDNEIERALFRLEAYLRENEDDALVSMWFSKFLYFAGRLDAALIEIEKVLHLNPDLEGAEDVLSVVRTEIREREMRSK